MKELFPAHYQRLPNESERERLERLLKIVSESTKGETAYWQLQRNRIEKALQGLND